MKTTDYLDRLREEEPAMATVLDAIGAMNSAYDQIRTVMGLHTPPQFSVVSSSEATISVHATFSILG